MSRLIKPLTASRGPSYREAAYLAIKEAILSGSLEYGQSLIEEDIATQMQVSRTPVREALVILQHEGLISLRSGKGYHIRQMTHEEFMTMFVANEVVEPYLARRAALMATDEQLRTMEDAITQGKQAAVTDDIPGILRSGRDFHKAVGVASDNMALTNFVVNNEERTDLYLLSYETLIDMSRMNISNQEHEMIFNAISQRDPEAAARLVIYHTQSVRERLSSLFNKSEFQKMSAAKEGAK